MIPPIKMSSGASAARHRGVYLAPPKPSSLPDLARNLREPHRSKRITQLIARYGPDVVKGVMRKIIDNAEAAFLAKMAKLPDGAWRERSYVEVAKVGDRGTYPALLTMRKEGDRLVFDNAGTAPQTGAINTTYSGWRGSILTALNELLCWISSTPAAAPPPQRVPTRPGRLHLRDRIRPRCRRAGAGHGDLALPGLQHAVEVLSCDPG